MLYSYPGRAHWTACTPVSEACVFAGKSHYEHAVVLEELILKTGALGQPRGMGWERRWEGFRDGGTHVHQWLILVNVLQNPPQYSKVISLQLK